MFFDIHAHVYKYPYPGGKHTLFLTEQELDEHRAQHEITGAALLPIVSSEVYMPQSVGEIIDIAAASGGKYIPFCNIDPRVLTNTSDAPIGNLIDFYMKQGCRGIGEVMPNLPWSDERMQNLLACVEKAGIPLLFDMTGNLDRGYGIYDEPGMPQLEACLNKFPDLIFIGHGPAFWSEIGTLRSLSDRRTYPKYPIDAEGRVPLLMREYANLRVDLSAGSGSNAMLRDPAYAEMFLNEFNDRIMFGTDTCYVGEPLPITGFLKELRESGKLSREAFDAIARKNAYRLLEIDG